jgi:hypothetical protein
LKYLKDQGVYPRDACSIISRKRFSEDNRSTTFQNFNLEEEQLYMDVKPLQIGRKAETTEWYEANKSISSWME